MATLYTLAPNVKRQLFDDDGLVLNGGFLYTKIAGTNTDAPTYQTSNGTLHANPIELDSSGRITGSQEIYMTPGSVQDWTLTDSLGNVIWTQPGIAGVPVASASVDNVVSAGEALAAGDGAYISDGSGGKTAGKAYKWSSANPYSSTRPTVGIIVNDVAAGSDAVLRTAGEITLPVAILPGLDYYAGVGGALTTTAAANARRIGQATTVSVLTITANPPPEAVSAFIASLCQFRLTLTTGLPVTVADVTAAGTLFWTPYVGNAVALYSGTAWAVFNLAQLSIAVPAVATQVYDVFVDYNGGVPALSLTAWTNDTTRATALTTQDGVLVLSGSTGKRYVGTVRTVAASQVNDSFALRHVWNYYNRVPRTMRVLPTTDTWAYTVATLRQANASAANQLDCVIGVAEVELNADVVASMFNDTGGVTALVSIGQDSTTTAMTGVRMTPVTLETAAVTKAIAASVRSYPPIGRHVFVWLEYSTAVGITTWNGDGGNPALIQSGIHGTILG